MTRLWLQEEAGADLELGNRYHLWRRWDSSKLSVLWVMLNPSVADGFADDPTVTRCIGFAERWGYGGIDVVNLYSVIATDPSRLRELNWPQGPRDDAVIRQVLDSGRIGMVVYAWGNHGRDDRARQVDTMVCERGFVPQCLGHTRSGQPRHPVRLGYDTELVEFRPRWRKM